MARRKRDLRILTLDVDPEQGVARLAASVKPPDGYVFFKLVRKGKKAVITFRRPLPEPKKERTD